MNSSIDTNPFNIIIAGLTIRIRPIHGYLRELCAGYISDATHNGELEVSVTADDILSEKEKISGASAAYNIGKGMQDDASLETVAVYRKICEAMPDFDTILLHSAVVAYEGEGYAFFAPSGVGKTTRALLFLREFQNSFIVNGDKPLIKVTDDNVLAFGTPWCGKEKMNRNTSVPLKAIFYVERAEEDASPVITELKGAEAYTLLLQQTFHPSDPKAYKKTLLLLKKLMSRVKIFRLRTAPTQQAMRLAWEMAKGNM